MQTRHFPSHLLIHFVIYFHANQLFDQPFAYSFFIYFSCKPVISSAICLFIFLFFSCKPVISAAICSFIFQIFSCKPVISEAICLFIFQIFSCKPVISSASCLFICHTCIIFMQTSYFSSNQWLTWFVIYFHANQLFQKPVAYSICRLFPCKPVASAANCLFSSIRCISPCKPVISAATSCLLGLPSIFMQTNYFRSQLLIQCVCYFHANQ